MTTAVMNAREVTLALLSVRALDATLCPSEVARALARAASVETTESDWRDMMPVVHAAVDGLVAGGEVRLSWKGQGLSSRAGPYRIGHLARA
jgi:hypothetical protein